MKKYMALVLALVCALGLVGCASKTDRTADIPELSEIADYTQEQLEEKLIGLSDEEMYNSWGEPDSMLSGLWGDIWSLGGESDKKVILYYDKDGIVEHIICSLPDEKVVSNEVRWEYTPVMSSRYPAMPFSFDVSCQTIMAVCDNGTLVDFDNFDDISQSYPQGKSLTIQNTDKLYWAPWAGEDGTDAASAEVAFTVLSENGTVLYRGILSIVRAEETKFGAIYSATLEVGSGLTLTQEEYQLGGILTQLSN